MRAIAAAVVLLFASLATADPNVDYKLSVELGYVGPVEFDFGQDVTTYAGTWTVYATGGSVTGTVLFTKTLSAGSTTSRLRCTLIAGDTVAPGSYYFKGTRTTGGVVEPWHGTLIVSGR